MVEKENIVHNKSEQEIGHEPAKKFVGEEGERKKTSSKGIEGGGIVKQAAKIFADNANLHAKHRGCVLLRKLRNGGDPRVQNIAKAAERNAEREYKVIADVWVNWGPEVAANGKQRAAGHGEKAALAFLLTDPAFITPVETFGSNNAGFLGVGERRAVRNKPDRGVCEILSEETESVGWKETIGVGKNEKRARGAGGEFVLHGALPKPDGRRNEPNLLSGVGANEGGSPVSGGVVSDEHLQEVRWIV